MTIRRIPPSRSDLVTIYDRTAWYWDSLLHRVSYGLAYARLFNRLRRDGWLGNADRSARVLDCGIGTGLFSDALVRAVNASFEIHGVDISPKMMARARSRLMRSSGTARLVCGDVCSLPFADGEMDLVICALMLEHAPSPLGALREMTRVLGVGATLVLVVTRPHAPDLPFRLKYRYNPFLPTQLIEWMTDAGLRDIRTYSLAGIARLFGCAYGGRKA